MKLSYKFLFKNKINIISNLMLLLFSLIFALVLSEVGFRLLPQSRQYKLAQYEGKNMMFVDRYGDGYRRYKPSAKLGYELIPNYTGSFPLVNSQGRVGREAKFEKEAGIFRIFFIGDSITEEHLYIAELEKKLDSYSQMHQNGYKFELLNGGVGGYNLPQYLDYIRFKAVKYNPDMIIIGLDFTDFDCGDIILFKDNKEFTQFYYSAPFVKSIFTPNNTLFRYSYLYRFFIFRLDNYLAQKLDKKNIHQQEEIGSFYLNKILSICRKKKIPLLCIIFPYLKPIKEYTHDDMIAYTSLLNILKRLDISYINLHNYFPEDKRYELRQSKNDYIHPSGEGHRIAGSVIFEYLKGHLIKTDIIKNKIRI